MDDLNQKINNNIKYKFIIVILLFIGIILAAKSLIIIKNVNTKEIEVNNIDKKPNKEYVTKRIEYSEIINSLKEINQIKILSFNNEKVKDIIAINVEITDNSDNIQNIFNKIKKMKGFYSIDSIKIDDYKDKTLKILLNINFTKAMQKEV